MHRLRLFAEGLRASSADDAQAPPLSGLDAPQPGPAARFLSWLFNELIAVSHDLAPSPPLVRAMRANPRWIDDTYLDPPPDESVTDDIETWPAWTLVPTDLLDLDRFSDCCGALKPKPCVRAERQSGLESEVTR